MASLVRCTEGDLPTLYSKARVGEEIRLCRHPCRMEFSEITPHQYGFIGYTDTTSVRSVYLNGELLVEAYANQYLTFYGSLVLLRGNKFYIVSVKNHRAAERLLYQYRGRIKVAMSSFGGKIVIFDENGETITVLAKKTLGRLFVSTFQQPWDSFSEHLSTDHVVTCKGGKFFRDGNPQEFFSFAGEWKSYSWWEYGDTIAVLVDNELRANNNELLYGNAGQRTEILSCAGHIVTRTEVDPDYSIFSVDGHTLKGEVPCRRCYYHWCGPIVEWRGQYTLIVVK